MPVERQVLTGAGSHSLPLLRSATAADLAALASLEARSFPPAEAADAARLKDRLQVFPDRFWLLCQGSELLAYACGLLTDEPDLVDDMYANARLHNPDGHWQMLFSVCTDARFRHQGLATRLLQEIGAQIAAEGRCGIVLTCKDALIPLYALAGFADEGISPYSSHGGVAWHQMRLVCQRT